MFNKILRKLPSHHAEISVMKCFITYYRSEKVLNKLSLAADLIKTKIDYINYWDKSNVMFFWTCKKCCIFKFSLEHIKLPIYCNRSIVLVLSDSHRNALQARSKA